MVRCKFELGEIRSYPHGTGKTLVFSARYDTTIPEDQRFAKATPSGRFEMFFDNQAALEFFELGKSYYFDAVPVPDAPKP